MEGRNKDIRKAMTKRDRQALTMHIEKASELCVKYGLTLRNGGDIASMLFGISSEIANNEVIENEYLKD